MKKWFPYIKPYLKFFILCPVCMVVEVAGEVIMPRILSVIINHQNNGTLTISSSIIYMLLMVITAIFMLLGGVGGAYYGAKASVNFATDLREDIYSAIQKFSFSNLDKFQGSSLMIRLTSDVTQLQNFVNMLLRMTLRAPGMMIAALIMAISLNPDLSVVFAVSLPIIMLIIASLIFKGFSRFALMQKKLDQLNSTVQENLTNVRVVKSFVREDYEIEKFHQSNKSLKDAHMSAMNILIFMQPVMTFIINATVIAVILIGGSIVLDMKMEIGDLSAFLTYVSQILFSFIMITFMLMHSSRALASAKRIREVLDEPIDLSDDTAKYPDLKVKSGSIRFENVSFRYFANRPNVLSGINLEIPAGKTVGIIGSTGCGKSSLISLIPRLYDATEGTVYIDDVDVKDYSMHNLRDGISVVLQKNTLFSGTISDNLHWGDESASEEELIQASEYAQADKFVKNFTDAYDTVISQGGTNVSGGQKQRLCIARALLKKPKILIFDDSTSAVDTATESKIRYALHHNIPNSTKIIIAQRVNSVQDADMIIVMNDGAITAIGTHEELLSSSQEYREIYDSQQGRS